MPLAEALPMVEDATMADVSIALKVVMAAHGREMDPGRIKTVAMLILDQGWKRAELEAASRVLASDPGLRDTLRYGGTITPADFETVRRADEKTVGEGEDKRVIVTRSGFALKVARARLYDYAEAMGIWRAAGESGPFGTDSGRYPDAMFEAVKVEGQERVMWRFA